MKLFKQLLLITLIVISSLFTNAQNVGIGTTTPTNLFQIGDVPSSIFGNSFAIGANGGGFGVFQYANVSQLASSVDLLLYPNSGSGYVGINTNPGHTLDIFSHGNAQINLSEGVGGQTALFSRYSNRLEIQPSDAFEISIGAVDQRNLCVANNGDVGIGTATPANLLQIGSVGSTNYSGNDIAFGSTDGTQASGIAQTTTQAQWYSTSNIALMPKGNGQGRVGINITSPGYPLDVEDYANDISIYAEGYVSSGSFVSSSDARIKDIEDVSNSTKDLQTLNAIQITDYTMKDKVRNGNKQFKKIIAQQVEEVYPQVVNKGVNYIPNVYQLTDKIEKTVGGYLLSFKTAHNISKEAKKLQLIDKNGAQQRYDIVSIPSDNEVLIEAPDLKSDTVFVYGEQVNDFRTVDYDGLTTLNISATQELSKLVKQQQAEIDAQNAKIAELVEMVKKLMPKG